MLGVTGFGPEMYTPRSHYREDVNDTFVDGYL